MRKNDESRQGKKIKADKKSKMDVTVSKTHKLIPSKPAPIPT